MYCVDITFVHELGGEEMQPSKERSGNGSEYTVESNPRTKYIIVKKCTNIISEDSTVK